MFKLVCVLLGSFWLSCGNTAKTAQDKTTSSEEKVERIQTVSTSEDEQQKIEKSAQGQETIKEVKKPSQLLEMAMEKPNITKKVRTAAEHSLWNTLLAKYVNERGDVDYNGFQNDAFALDEYLNHLAENSPKKSWSKNEKLAYYINLYNAATVKLILDNYPTKSIRDIKNPWGKDRVKTGDGILSLGDIEHKVLRKMDEPRIHFAINCASFSCPKLLNKAFEADQIESQLHDVTLDFINDGSRNSISKEKMRLSNIFKWYKKDFTKNGSLTDYIKPYTKVEIDSDTDIDYLKYDWNLNEAK